MPQISEKELEQALANVAVLLVEPKYPENIGAAARVAMNCGINRLLVVREEAPDREKMLKMATHKAADLIAHRRALPARRPPDRPAGTIRQPGKRPG